MRLRFLFFALLTTSAAVLPITACSSDPATTNRLVVTDDDASTPKPKDAGKTDSNVTPGPDGSAGPSRVYAHTADTLYLFDSASKSVTPIGAFSCLTGGDSVLDIAVDRTGAMYGTTYQGFISIDPINASCQVVKNDTTYPNSLSFVPAGTVDATKEVLVGYAFNNTNFFADQYVRIDPATGGTTTIGDLNAGNTSAIKWRASGDVISLINAGNKAYLTARKIDPDAGTDTTTDYLVEIDPTTGAFVKALGPTGVPLLYGLGYWAGKGYGFASDGKVIAIDMTAGTSQLLMTLTVDGGPGSWYGAGVTTQAPVAP